MMGAVEEGRDVTSCESKSGVVPGGTEDMCIILLHVCIMHADMNVHIHSCCSFFLKKKIRK